MFFWLNNITRQNLSHANRIKITVITINDYCFHPCYPGTYDQVTKNTLKQFFFFWEGGGVVVGLSKDFSGL